MLLESAISRAAVSILCKLSILLVVMTGTSVGQGIDPLPVLESREVPLDIDSVDVENTGAGAQSDVVFETEVEVPGAGWLRPLFSEVTLSGGGERESFIRITALADEVLEGEPVQELRTRTLREWQNTGAYFNGNRLRFELVAFPNTGVNRLVMTSIEASPVGLRGRGGSICGTMDNRVPSTERESARVLPAGCTAFLFEDSIHHCFLTAGHCFGCGPSPAACMQVCQFNVPPSNPVTGAINFPGPEDQYPTDPASFQFQNAGTGNDWGYFGCFTNYLGETAFQRQGAAFTLAAAPPAVAAPPQDIRITGYGVERPPQPPPIERNRNQTQQTHTGPYALFAGTLLRYSVDTRGGNSGSAVFDTTAGNVVGVHTHAGCATAAGTSNQGTAINQANLQAALAAPTGICATPLFIRGDCDGSATINITDALFLIGCLFLGTGCPTCDDAADANDDGRLDISDPVYKLNFLFLGGFPPPSPHPGCGPDLSPDALGCASYPGC